MPPNAARSPWTWTLLIAVATCVALATAMSGGGGGGAVHEIAAVRERISSAPSESRALGTVAGGAARTLEGELRRAPTAPSSSRPRSPATPTTPSTPTPTPTPTGEDPCASVRVQREPSNATDARVALVTGGAGFIGSHLVDLLLRLGYRVRVLDNLSTGSTANVPGEGVEFVRGDVRAYEDVERAMRARGVGGGKGKGKGMANKTREEDAIDASDDGPYDVAVVFHLAAMSKVLPSLNASATNMTAFCVENNVVGTENVLRAAKRAGTVEKVVYAASSTHYGRRTRAPRSLSLSLSSSKMAPRVSLSACLHRILFYLFLHPSTTARCAMSAR